jgi:gamma-D-glutamyl-L-lysine dipeptidyl-peptidase
MNRLLAPFLVLLYVSACGPSTKSTDQTPAELPPAVAQALEALKKDHAPDGRVAWFQVEAKTSGDSLLLVGDTNLPAAHRALDSALRATGEKCHNLVALLPSPGLEGKTGAVVKVSVANLRSQPKHAAELATQALLGTPLKVWKKEGGWYLVQTPDQYLAWVDGGAIERQTPDDLALWLSASKLIYTELYGQAYAQPDAASQPMGDLVAGNILLAIGQERGYVKAAYPDGRTAYVRAGECQPLADWLGSRQPTGPNLVKTAKRLMGLPYLWGGTSAKGVDCSGFTKTAYFLNGVVIPRDASQQVHTGQAVDTVGNFAQLQPGDLLFFGRPATDSTAEKVVHVGMWVGDQQFIHASNMVRLSSMDAQAPNYDDYERKRFLRAKRLLGGPASDGVFPVGQVFWPATQ